MGQYQMLELSPVKQCKVKVGESVWCPASSRQHPESKEQLSNQLPLCDGQQAQKATTLALSHYFERLLMDKIAQHLLPRLSLNSS